MKVLVTGANGFLGRGVVTELVNRGYNVIATDIRTKGIDERAQIIESDIFELSNPFDFFGNPDVVIHLAWRDGFVHYSEKHILDLYKHYKFIKDLVDEGCNHIAIMGTMHEIGYYEGSINENTPCNPLTPYGIAKNALRQLTYTMSLEHKIVWQWLRGYYIVSNDVNSNSIFGKIARKSLEGEKEFPFTSGQNQYDFVDYEKFCETIVDVIGQERVNGIIEICSGKPEKLKDRVERFIYENGYDIKLLYGKYPDRLYDSKAIWGSYKKLEEIYNE